jgi:hypothetical protein
MKIQIRLIENHAQLTNFQIFQRVIWILMGQQ